MPPFGFERRGFRDGFRRPFFFPFEFERRFFFPFEFERRRRFRRY